MSAKGARPLCGSEYPFAPRGLAEPTGLPVDYEARVRDFLSQAHRIEIGPDLLHMAGRECSGTASIPPARSKRRWKARRSSSSRRAPAVPRRRAAASFSFALLNSGCRCSASASVIRRWAGGGRPRHPRGRARPRQGDPPAPRRHRPISGFGERLPVGRYHSLCSIGPPARFHVLAEIDDLAMAIANLEAMQTGLQFHPESVLTRGGSRTSWRTPLEAARLRLPRIQRLRIRPYPDARDEIAEAFARLPLARIAAEQLTQDLEDGGDYICLGRGRSARSPRHKAARSRSDSRSSGS